MNTSILFLIAQYLVFAVALVVGIAAYRRKRLALFVLSLTVSVLLATVLKHLIGGARPFETLGLKGLYGEGAGESFPSRHTAILTTLVLLSSDSVPLLVFSLAGALITVLLRLYLHLHWLTDIAGGAAVGAFAYWAALQLLARFKR